MVTLFGTLGWHPSKFLDVLPRSGEKIDRVVLYTGAAREEERRKSQEALDEVTSALEAMNLPFTHRDFRNPWDFSTILRAFLTDLRDEWGHDVVLNLTGGPKTMTVAATVACLLLGIRVFYVPEEIEAGADPIELPLFRIRYSQVLSEKQQAVLRVIRDREPQSLDELGSHLGKSNTTVTFHIRNLEKAGAVILLTDSKNRLVRTPKLTPTGEIMLLAEEILGEKGRGID